MYSYYVQFPCTVPMYSSHVQLPCTATMYSSHVQLPCTATHHNHTAIYMYIHIPTVGSVKEESQKKVQYALIHGQCIVTDVCVWQGTCIARRVMHAEKVFSFINLAHTI